MMTAEEEAGPPTRRPEPCEIGVHRVWSGDREQHVKVGQPFQPMPLRVPRYQCLASAQRPSVAEKRNNGSSRAANHDCQYGFLDVARPIQRRLANGRSRHDVDHFGAPWRGGSPGARSAHGGLGTAARPRARWVRAVAGEVAGNRRGSIEPRALAASHVMEVTSPKPTRSFGGDCEEPR